MSFNRSLKLIFAIFFVSTFDVRVRALTLEEPKKCTAGFEKCAVYTEEHVETLSLSSAVAWMAKGATLERESASELKVVRGLAKIKASAKTTVQTLYGELEFSEGEVLLEVRDAIVKFTNLSANLKYTPRGEGESHSLPIGFSTYFAGITKSGVADAGYPKPAEIEPLIKNWSKLYTRSEKTHFSNDLKDFMKSWHEAAKLVGPWYVDVVRREIASQEAEEARLARLRAAQDAENSRYRDMFRSKVFSEQ